MCMNVPVAAAAKESHLKTSKVQKLRKIKWECSKHVGSKAVCYLNTLSLFLAILTIRKALVLMPQNGESLVFRRTRHRKIDS